MFRGKSATNGEGQTGGVPFNHLGVAAEEQNRTDKEAEDEQEDLWIYESEVGGVLFWRRLGRRFGRFGPVVTPRRLVETSLWGF